MFSKYLSASPLHPLTNGSSKWSHSASDLSFARIKVTVCIRKQRNNPEQPTCWKSCFVLTQIQPTWDSLLLQRVKKILKHYNSAVRCTISLLHTLYLCSKVIKSTWRSWDKSAKSSLIGGVFIFKWVSLVPPVVVSPQKQNSNNNNNKVPVLPLRMIYNFSIYSHFRLSRAAREHTT